jgi:hypothetical protein
MDGSMEEMPDQCTQEKCFVRAAIVSSLCDVVRDAKYQDLRQPIVKTIYISWLQREGEQPSRYNYLVRWAWAIRCV